MCKEAVAPPSAHTMYKNIAPPQQSQQEQASIRRNSLRAKCASDKTHDRPSINNCRSEVRNTFLHFWEEGPKDEIATIKRSVSLPNLADLKAHLKAVVPCDEHPAEQLEMTRLMVRHIPCRLSKEQILQVLDGLIPPDTYDSIHVPGRRRHKGVNLGYFFMMVQQKHAETVRQALEGKPFGKTLKCQKLVEVTAGFYRMEEDKAACYEGVLPNGLWSEA